MNNKPDRSVITMCIGQCGIQTGMKLWELMAYEHDIRPDGSQEIDADENGNIHSFFIETLSGRYVPKTLLYDTDNNVINEIQYLPQQSLFSEQYTACGTSDSCGVFSIAKDIIENKLAQKYKNAMRVLLEQCDITIGCMTYSALGGGTGSAGALLAQSYYKLFEPKSPCIWNTLYPSNSMSNLPVESLNTGFALSDKNGLSQNIDLQIIYDNEALYNRAKQCMKTPVNYAHLNMLVARVNSCISASMRFPSELNVDIRDLAFNLTPNKQYKYVYPTFSPANSNNTNYRLAVSDITSEVLKTDCSMLSEPMFDDDVDKYDFIAMALLYRGDVQPSKVYESMSRIQNKTSDDFTGGFYPHNSYIAGINADLLLTPESWSLQDPCRACCGIFHHTRVIKNFQMIGEKINTLINKDAYTWNFDANTCNEAQLFLEEISNDYSHTFAKEQ